MAQVISKKEINPKQNLKYQRDKAREIVKGIFRYYEVPGGAFGFNFREFKEDPIEFYEFVDGEIYSIPLGVARHLNKNCWYPEYEFVPGDPGVRGAAPVRGFAGGHTQRVSKKVRRVGFQSLEFVDVDDMPQHMSQVVAVESV